MLCPKCHDQVLVPVERQGVEIDYCPGCRGVWLDRGELDKMIEQSAALPPARAKEVGSGRYEDQRAHRRDEDDDYERGTYKDSRGRRRNKMSSFLEDIFDFD